jgi:transcriptional regulator with XRE-family HTH domain
MRGSRIVPAELRAELARRGWRQLDLARAVGVSRGLIGLICTGMQPSRRVEAAVLAALGPDGAARVTYAAAPSLHSETTGAAL